MESVEQTKAGLRFKAPKTEQARAVTLPAFAVDELRRLKRQQAENLLQLGVRQTGETLVCCREDGEVLQPTSLTHQFTYLMGRSPDLPRLRFHDLRHSHATQLLVEGVPPQGGPGAPRTLLNRDYPRPLFARHRYLAGGRGVAALLGVRPCYKAPIAGAEKNSVAISVAKGILLFRPKLF